MTPQKKKKKNHPVSRQEPQFTIYFTQTLKLFVLHIIEHQFLVGHGTLEMKVYIKHYVLHKGKFYIQYICSVHLSTQIYPGHLLFHI